jgi:uncharacterized protein (DUF362 family)
MAKVVLTQSVAKDFNEQDIANTVGEALDALNFNFSDEIKTVVIKPNLCYYWNNSTGETTDPQVVSAVIDYVREKLGNCVDISVAEADASAMKTRFSFSVLGYDKMCQKKGVNLKNLSEGEISEVKVKVKQEEFALTFNKDLLDADLVINVPKLKTHNFVGATCALKNMFGAISKPRKYSYHKKISEVIVAANKIVKSHITLVDGLIVRGSCPKKLGVVLAGDDPLATDFVASRIMGFNPKRLKYLSLAAKEQIGETKNIDLIEHNVRLADVKKDFPSYSYLFHTVSWSLQLRMLRTYAKIVGDVIPPFLEN